MNYRDFFTLQESMTTSVVGADYESKDLENLLGVSFILMRKVVNPVYNTLSKFDMEYFQQNRSMEVITPDGDDTFKPTGTLNFYVAGFREDAVKKIIDGVKRYLPQVGLTLGGVRGPEKSKSFKSDVVRFDITSNKNVDKSEEVPEVQLSNANAHLIYGDVLQLPDFEEGYTIEAMDLYNRIKDVLDRHEEDETYLTNLARLPSMDVGDKGAMMYGGAMRADDIVDRLKRIAQLCLYAMKHGHNKISIA